MKAQGKVAVRLLKKHLTRLFTIVAIVIVSLGFMTGILEVENKIRIAVEEYYAKYNLSDLYLKSKNAYGFTQAEREEIKEQFGEENVEESLCFETEEEGDIVRVYALNFNENRINRLQLLEGKYPTSQDEIVAERQTEELEKYALGERVRLQGREYTVCGIVYNPLLILEVEEPSFAFEGKGLDKVFYQNAAGLPMVNDVHITLENRDLFEGYSDDYKQEIDKRKVELTNALGEENVSVLSLYENAGLYSLISYAEKVGLIGIVFVVFFLLVTLLIVYSTMTRLLDEERGQIACQKTLGYGNFGILNKYVRFVFLATLIGGLLAFPVGLGLTSMIYAAFSLNYRMPAFPATLNFTYYFLTFGIVVIATTLLTFFNGMHVIKRKPVELLAPKAPKSGKRVLLEKIPFIWNRLSFKYKSTVRNVFLFKSRFFMTVISIVGSTVLVFAGMGLMDCALKTDNATSLLAIAMAVIVFSAALCALVIYNLTNINVSERNREIATLMVLGYHSGEVTGYIFREIYIMSAIGAVLGVPLGVGFVEFVFGLIDFGALADINWWTYLLTPLITMLFSWLSTKLLRRKITKTDMNASLKTLE